MTSDELVARCDELVALGVKPSLTLVRPLVCAFYALPGNGVGGALHIVLDDGNYYRSSVQWCINKATTKHDAPAVALGRLLLLLSNSQRRRLTHGDYYPS